MSSPRALHATSSGIANRVDLCSDVSSVIALLLHACEDAGFRGKGSATSVDDAATLSVVVALSSGHAAVHTDKRSGAVFLDAFTVEPGARPLAALEVLRRAFEIEGASEDVVVRTAEG